MMLGKSNPCVCIDSESSVPSVPPKDQANVEAVGAHTGACLMQDKFIAGLAAFMTWVMRFGRDRSVKFFESSFLGAHHVASIET